jgi:aminomethyltransferase
MTETPLRSLHESLGARFTNFGGWDMPVQYSGVIAEHMAVRDSVGIFDVTHLGRFEVSGPVATDAVRALLCNDIAKVEPGRAQYTMALNDHGGVEDDIIVWRLDDNRYWVMPNGTNYHEILGRFVAQGEGRLDVDPIQDDTVLIAVQGPQAPDVIEAVAGMMPGRFRCVAASYCGAPLWMAGTGYTGERGAELAVPISAAEDVFRAFLDAGAAPCGLGARDTLRLEMGYPLWGQDLDPSTTPLEAGLGWVVAWDHDFVGRSALERQRAEGIDRELVGFRTVDRRVPRHGYRLRCGRSNGEVASGNFSPVLERGIGMGYLSPQPPPDEPLEVEIRGVWTPLERVTPPFIDR